MLRWTAAALGALLGANALVQIAAPFWWYGAVPGVPATGAYNPHFVRDIGAAYLVVAAGLLWFAWRPAQGWAALAAGAGFLTLHAGVHLFDASCSASPLADLIRDLPGVFLPAMIACAIAVAARPKRSLHHA
ncbi:MAG: hypothetical protein ACK4YQ_07385 [Phenylobacterium sp.]|uniref:hypothetical protein n=1 Tax=Phenylobacterium sp. TaxID=1871053 RepID=UPI003919DE46